MNIVGKSFLLIGKNLLRRCTNAMECLLVSSEEFHDPIYLPDRRPIIVGRSATTKIRDKKVSRSQVELTADYKSQSVLVKQLGSNPSSVNNITLFQNKTHTLGRGGKLSLLRGKYEHSVCFKPGDCIDNQKNQRNKITDSEQSGKSNQKRMCEALDYNSPSKRRKTAGIDSKDNAVVGFGFDDPYELEDLKEEFGDNIIQEIKNSHDQKNDMLTSFSNRTNKITNNREDFIDLKPTSSCQWDEIESGKLLVYKSEGLIPRSKIVGLDLDGTIITTKSGKVFATGPEDWKIKLTESLKKLQSLQDDGFKIVIFTNQGSIGRGKLKKEDFRRKVEKIGLKLKVPFQLFAATDHGIYRKPLNGMWKYLVEEDNCGLDVDKTKSFYVGDAAGRPVNWAPKEKKDFACSDRTVTFKVGLTKEMEKLASFSFAQRVSQKHNKDKDYFYFQFAENVGIQFFTPEEFFLNHKPAAFKWPEFNPKSLSTDGPLYTPQTAKLVVDELEVILLVGFPASGKTSFVKKHLIPHGYKHINRDTCGSWQKCVAMCKVELSRKNSVVIDNTSPDKDSRQRYVQQAKKSNVPVRCFLFDVSYEHALHNNRIREITTTDKNYKSVGKMVFNSYRSSFQEPSLSEGFTEILKINFIPNFESSDLKYMYMQYSG